MNCEEACETLLALEPGLAMDADMDQSAGARQRVAEAREHLRGCEACQQTIADFERLWKVMRKSAADDENEVVPSGGWDAYEKRLLRRVHRQQFWQRTAIGGVAAALLISLLGLAFYAGRSSHSSPVAILSGSRVETPSTSMTPSTSDVPLSSIAFTAPEVKQAVSAFDQIASGDRRTSWVLDSDSVSDMGTAKAPIDQQKVLLLRLSVMHNKQAISSADLVIVPGQAADLSLPLSGGQSLHYQVGTSTGDHTRLSVVVELVTPGRSGTPIAALATTLDLQPGEKVSAGQFLTGSGAYQLDIAFARSNLPENVKPHQSKPHLDSRN